MATDIQELTPMPPQAGVRKEAVITSETKGVRRLLIGLALGYLGLFLVIPLVTVFAAALEKGFGVYIASITEPDARSAILLTLVAVLIAVPVNMIFGIAAAWALTKFKFAGKNLLITLIDLPITVSPVIAGMIYILLFGAHSWLGKTFNNWGIQIIFAVPAIIIATLFVTLPFVARELISLMQSQGNDEEETAILLGASGWQTFRKITLPNIKWGLLYGVILCSARAMGEFGAVSVVSGHIRGLTNTMTLHVEILYNEYNFTAAFAVASLLTLVAVVTLILKSIVEWKTARMRHEGEESHQTEH